MVHLQEEDQPLEEAAVPAVLVAELLGILLRKQEMVETEQLIQLQELL